MIPGTMHMSRRRTYVRINSTAWNLFPFEASKFVMVWKVSMTFACMDVCFHAISVAFCIQFLISNNNNMFKANTLKTDFVFHNVLAILVVGTSIILHLDKEIRVNVQSYIAWDDLTYMIYLHNNYPNPIPVEL